MSRGSNRMGEVLAGMSRQLAGVFAFLIQNPPQASQTVKNARLDGAERTLKDLRDFLVSEPLAKPQRERLPLAIGQLCNARPEAFFPFGNFRRGVGAGRGAHVGELIVPQDPQLSPAHPKSPAFAAVEVQQNAVQPGV